ncbi:MAG: TetR/AcrR family transcriptional regulator [Solirubrobacterales bacterium]|nr:TetR/AcrR family transcriptional regulator [Solirubrobacterales bacterium]
MLDSTLDVLADQGFGYITVEAVAQRAGVTRPVIYDTFGDLESLLLALIDRGDQRVSGQLAEILGPGVPADADPDEFLIERISMFLSAVRADPRHWRLALMPPPGTSQELNFRLQRVRAEIAGHLRALLEWGLSVRGGPHGIDLEMAARLFVAVGEDAARLMLAHPRRFRPERLANATVDLLALFPAGSTVGAQPPERPEIPAPVLQPAHGASVNGAVSTAVAAPRKRVPQAERREQLLDVALELVAEQGFDSLSVEGIARRAGVNRVVIYRSFSNLGVLIATLMHREDLRVRSTLRGLIPQDPVAAVASGISPREVLYDALHHLLSAVAERPLTWSVALLRPESAPRALQRIVNRRRAALAKRIEPLIAWVLASKEPEPPAYHVEAMARMLLTVGEEQARLALTEQDAFPPARLLRGTWRLLEALDLPE